MTGLPILTAAEMRAAEQLLFDGGMSVEALMERAGAAAAEVAWRYAGNMPALVLCGPGNNGGDGYVIARLLAARGVSVRVAASGDPKTAAAAHMRSLWKGPVEDLDSAASAPLLIDALFGTGLARPLDVATITSLERLARAAKRRIAVDLPSGVATDDGGLFEIDLQGINDKHQAEMLLALRRASTATLRRFRHRLSHGTVAAPAHSDAIVQDVTIALGALKPAHLLQPAAALMGRIVVADIGVPVNSLLHRLDRPALPVPGPQDHKYTRGHVFVVGGDMHGAALLAARAAQRAGAGYVSLSGVDMAEPAALVHRQGDLAKLLADDRIKAVAIGPGLGRDDAARAALGHALLAGRPLILDADALMLLEPSALHGLGSIVTPHEGEFAALFGKLPGSKVERARVAAAQSDAVVVLKGADTVVAAPDGRAAIAAPASGWLASAGTGDVLTGAIAACRARGLDPFEATIAGVWLHAEAARLAGPGLIADDLIAHLPAALEACA